MRSFVDNWGQVILENLLGMNSRPPINLGRLYMPIAGQRGMHSLEDL
jgi:hypothetical protein